MDFRLVIPVYEARAARRGRAGGQSQTRAAGSGTFAGRGFGSYPGDRTFQVVSADGRHSLQLTSYDMSRFSKKELDAMFEKDSDSD